MVGMLSWNFYVCEYKFTQAVYSCHQCRGIPIVGGVEMQDIASSHCHCLANSWCGPAMGGSQESDEFTPQVTNFRRGEVDVMRNQLASDFLNRSVPSEQGLANKNKQVIGDIAMFRNQALQRFGFKGAITIATQPNGLAGNKRPCHAEHCFTSCLLHLELRSTARTNLGFRNKTYNRRLRKQR